MIFLTHTFFFGRLYTWYVSDPFESGNSGLSDNSGDCGDSGDWDDSGDSGDLGLPIISKPKTKKKTGLDTYPLSHMLFENSYICSNKVL